MAKVSALLSGKSLITVFLLCWVTTACSRGSTPPNAGKPQAVPVKLQNVAADIIEESNEFPDSKLEAVARVELKPEVEGRVTQIQVKSGDRVAQGTPVVQLRPEKSQAEVGGAIANVNAARATLTNAEAQLRAAEDERDRAVADVKFQDEQFSRISTLVTQGALAKQQLDQVRRDRDAANAALNSAEEKVRAARATIDQQNSVLKQAESTVALRTEELKETRVLAPITGVVGDVPVKLGAYVKAGDTLTTIIQNDTLEVRLKIPVDQASQLRPGLPVQLTGANNNEVLSLGRISFISPQVDNSSQSVLAKATFPNPEGNLRDGQIVKARVIWSKKSGVLIPTTAIVPLAGQKFVFVAQEQQAKLIAHQKPVKLGAIQGNNYQVLEGLKPGEKVVISGLLNLSEGTPIKPES
jgi:RND family efflux transporter MFP subunit